MNIGPVYNLKKLKKLIKNSKTRHITNTSLIKGFELGFSATEIVEIILSLKEVNFYKTLPCEYNSSLWQDVYKTCEKNKKIYIKLQISSDNKGVIISFKEDTGDSYVQNR